jgi:hypothetical protein
MEQSTDFMYGMWNHWLQLAYIMWVQNMFCWALDKFCTRMWSACEYPQIFFGIEQQFASRTSLWAKSTLEGSALSLMWSTKVAFAWEVHRVTQRVHFGILIAVFLKAIQALFAWAKFVVIFHVSCPTHNAGLLTVRSWYAHGTLMVCSRYAHGVLTVRLGSGEILFSFI